MNKLFLTILIASSGSMYAQCESECASPSEYIKQFLDKSGTIHSGSKEWRDTLEEGKTVKTNFLATNDGNKLLTYSGLKVSLHTFFGLFAEVPVDTVKAYFEIKRQGDSVEIISKIYDTQVEKNLTDDDIAYLKQTMKKLSSGDECSMCVSKREITFNEATRTARITTQSTCTSKIPLDRFMPKLNKQRS